MKTENFKPQLLFKDEQSIIRNQENYRRGAMLLNKFVELVEETLSTKLDDDEKQSLKEKGLPFLIDRLRESFQFPKATDEFNLQAMGVDLKPAENYYRRNLANWNNYQYTIEEGQFKPAEATLEAEADKFHFYTQNPQQNAALRMAEKLKAQFQKADNAGLVSRFNKSEISRVTDLIEYRLNSDMKPEWQVNYHYIRSLK